MKSQPRIRLPRLRKSRRAFTRIELLAALAALAVLGVLVQPAMSESRSATRAAVCLSNKHRLQRAWAANAVDNQAWLVTTEFQTPGNPNRPLWMAAYLRYGSVDAGNPKFITNGPLFNYAERDLSVYKCPADRSVSEHISGQGGTPRICSVAMNQAFGAGLWLPWPKWRIYGRDYEIVTPATTWVFADEHPDSINDGGLAVTCDGAESLTGNGRIIDIPSSLHDGAGIFVFADGSADIHRWKGKAIRPPVSYGAKALALNIPAQDSQVDVVWLAARTTVRR